MLTVRECLALSELESMRVVAGERGLDRAVEFCHVVEEPDVEAWVRPGLFALSTGHPIHGGETGRQWVAALQTHGVSALAVALGRYLSEIPQDMLEEANDRDLPLMVIPWEIPFLSISAAVHRCLIDEQTTVLKDLITMQQEITEAALTAPALSQLIDNIRHLTGRSVSLGRRQSGPMTRFPLPSMPDSAVVLDASGDHDVDRYIGRQIALVTNLFMLRAEVERQLEWDARSRFISRFLLADSTELGHSRYESWPWHLDSRHSYRIIAVTLPLATLPGTSRPNPDMSRFRLEIWERLKVFDPFLTVDDIHQLLVAVVDEEIGVPSDVAERLSSLLEDNLEAAVVVAPAIRPDDLASQYQLLVRLVPFAECGKVTFMDTMIYPLVVSGLPETFMAVLLSMTWDRISNQTLKGTLRVWIEEMGSVTDTVAKLQIHRNTLRNRLNQIEQQLGQPLSRELIIQLQIALDWQRAHHTTQYSHDAGS